MNEDYDERITMSWRFWSLLSLLPSIAALGMLVLLLAAGTGLTVELLPGATLFLLVWAIMTFVVSRTMAVTLQIRSRRTWQGDAKPTLRVRGTRKGQTSYIPLDAIESVERVEFETRWGGSYVPEPRRQVQRAPAVETPWWKTFLSIRDADSPAVLTTCSQSGYRGPGLRVTYRAPTLTSGGELLTWKLQFPTRHPDRLVNLLTA